MITPSVPPSCPGETPEQTEALVLIYPTVYGRLIVDEGAEKALLEKEKPLPGGILAVEGDFQQGDPVEVLNKGRILIGKGLSNYSAREIELIRGIIPGKSVQSWLQQWA